MLSSSRPPPSFKRGFCFLHLQLRKMSASLADGSVLNGDGLDGLDNMELITFLESSFRRSEFIRVARILKAREESYKADSVKDLSEKLSLREAAIAKLREKYGTLKKELNGLRNKASYERVELAKVKTDYSALKSKEETAEEKIKGLLEQVQKYKKEKNMLLQIKNKNTVLECGNKVLQDEIDGLKRKYSEIEIKEIVGRQDLLKQKEDCYRFEEQVTSMKREYSALKAREQNAEEMFEILRVEAKWREKEGNDRIAELEVEVKELEYAKRMLQNEGDVWKSKYVLLEAWILQFLKEHPVLVESMREKMKYREKQNGNFFKNKETAVKLMKSDTDSDISIKSEAFFDMDLVSGTSSLEGTYNDAPSPRKSSEMRTSAVKYFDAAGSDKNCCKRKFQSSLTSEATTLILDVIDNYDSGDDTIPISQLKMKCLAHGNKEQKCASESCPIVCSHLLSPPTSCNRSSVSLKKHGREVSRSKDGTTGGSAIF